MPKLEYFLVCESVSIDRETNRISLFNVLEAITPVLQAQDAQYPLTQMAVVACWLRKSHDDPESEHEQKVRIYVPGREDAVEATTRFRMQHLRQRSVNRLIGMPEFKESGELRIELCLDGSHEAEHIVTVNPPVSVEVQGNSNGSK